MNFKRREFMELMGATVLTQCIPTLGSRSRSRGEETVEAGGWRIQIAGSGEILSVRNDSLELVNRNLGNNRPKIIILGDRVLECTQPVEARRKGSSVSFRFQFPSTPYVSLIYEIELLELADQAVALKQFVDLKTSHTPAHDLLLLLPRNIQLPFEGRKVFLPLKNGVGRRKSVQALANDDEYVFQLSGSYVGGRPQMLAVPFVDEYCDRTDWRLTFGADPFFTSYFLLPYQKTIGQFHCVFPCRLGFPTAPRTIYSVLHRRQEKSAMECFYQTSLKDVKPGPEWIHDIAMQDHDYHSGGGQGWFADIDALTAVILPPDRHKVLLATLWFDYMGRYAYNYRTRSLEKKWIALPRALEPGVQALGNIFAGGDEIIDPSKAMRWRKQSVKKMRPFEMSIEELHRMIGYAKQRGFKVALYFADGTAAGDGLPDIFDPTKVLKWGGWTGPDTLGRVYQQNPLHPEVRDFYKSYMQALLDEYGKEVDGLVWDETFYIDPGEAGNEAFPGYADRAMMTLMQEVATLVQNYSSHLALFASDDIGFKTWTHKAPYALVAHGTYQDSHCRPEAWPYGLFPNYRNTLWSVNWAPVTNYPLTKYGVQTFDVPVAISNGPFGDDTGVSEMKPGQLKKILDLFQQRKTHRMEIGWIREEVQPPEYHGKTIAYAWSV